MQVGVSVLGSSVHESPTKSSATESIGSTSTGNKSLDELRQHLERQTRETQRLQEEVEQATKLTMERMGRSLGGTAHEQPVSLNCSVDNSLNAQDLLTSHHISVSNHKRPYSIKSMAYRPEPAATVRSISFPGREHLERALEEYSLQVKELQRRLSEAHELHEQQKFYFRQSSVELQTKLREVQMERDCQADIRVEELILSHEQEVAALTDKLNKSHINAVSIQKQMTIVQDQAANQNVMYLRQLTELESTVSQLRSELREAKRMYEDKMEDLEKKLILAYSEVESAQSERDEYSRDSGDLDTQLHQLMTDLRKTREELNLEKEQNKRLWERESGNSITIDNLRRELDGRSMETQRMETLIKSTKEECRVLIDRQLAAEQDKNEVLEKASSLKSQLNATKEQLQKITESHRVSQEKVRQLETTLAQTERALEENHKERRNLQLKLEKRSQEVQLKQTEIEHYQENLEKGLGSLQTMKVEAETLKLKLSEKEKMVELVQQQMDNVTKLAGQHSRNAELMHSEKTQLQNELSERKIDIQRLKMEDQRDTLKLESQTKRDIIIKQHQERVEELILSHEQEVAALTDKLNKSHINAVSIQKQMTIVQDQAANQNVMYLRQLTELESTVSQLRSELREAKRMYEDKMEDLEKKLILAYSEVESAQSERDEYSRDSGDLDTQLPQLMTDLRKTREELNLEKEQNKRLWERESGNSITIDNLRRELDGRSMETQRMETLIKSTKEECRVLIDRQLAAEQDKNEVLEKASSLKSQLNATKEQLQKITESHRVSQEKVRQLETTLAQTERALEENHKERRNLQLKLEKRSQEVQLKQTEIEHYQENLEKGLGSLQTMKVEAETLKLKLSEKEKMVELVQQQMDNVTKLAGQHSRNAELMHSEKTQLQNELSERKIDIQRLKAAVEKQEERVGELVTRDSEKEQHLKAFTLEKEKLTAKLEVQGRQLARLTEQHEALKKSHHSKMKEKENATARLKSQLMTASAELEKTKSTLKTLEGADGHAVKVAMGMQKQITAKRGQIDALQSRIHFLEETVENIAKARQSQSQLSKRKIPSDLTALLYDLHLN
ncbi:UNVERIFIED_CONTAM: hypothetical protein FKN15_023272 [Acipenser sinensis]